jgi:hypothetical protein
LVAGFIDCTRFGRLGRRALAFDSGIRAIGYARVETALEDATPIKKRRGTRRPAPRGPLNL